MDVVIHNHEVPKLETELLFCLFNEVQKQLFDFGTLERHRTMDTGV
jgi:hypothetical protein